MKFKKSTIGKVPEHWEVTELISFLDRITYGFTNPMSDSNEGPWKITAKDINDGYINYQTARKTTQIEFETKLTDKSRPRVGDVLLTKDGSIGRVAVVDREGICINQSVALLQPNKKIDPHFLKFLLITPHYQRVMENDADGSTIKHIYITRVDKMEVAVPPLDEQKRILNIIKTIDDKIQLNRQINQTLEKIVQTIFKSWFVDFEPVKTKIAAKQSGEDTTRAAMRAISGLTDEQLDQLESERYQQLADTAALFPAEMEESGLGEIPRGWKFLPLSQMIELVGGGTPKRSETSYWGGNILWFSVKDAPADGDVFVIDTVEKITELGLNKSSTKLLPEGTTIISARGTVGRLALIGVPMAMNQSCYGVQGINEIGPIFNFFNLKNAILKLKQRAHGAVFDTITTNTFNTVNSIKPTNDILKEFERITTPLFSRIKNNLFEISSLSDSRDLLLPKLLSGEISV